MLIIYLVHAKTTNTTRLIFTTYDYKMYKHYSHKILQPVFKMYLCSLVSSVWKQQSADELSVPLTEIYNYLSIYLEPHVKRIFKTHF